MNEKKGNFIPSNPEKYELFMKRILDYASAHKTEWGHIPNDRLQSLTDAYNAFQDALGSYQNIPIKANRQVVRDTQAVATKELRLFIKQYLRFPPVTDADRVAMGIPNYDGVRTNHFEVSEKVEFTLGQDGPRAVKVRFKVLGASGRAKPSRYDGAVIIWAVLDKPPSGIVELTRHAMASSTPHTIWFSDEERCKKVYVALAWQNDRGIVGPWTDIQWAAVP